MKRHRSFIKDRFDEMYDLVEMLDEQRRNHPENSAECGYKIIVVTLLTNFYRMFYTLFVLLCFALGLISARVFF